MPFHLVLTKFSPFVVAPVWTLRYVRYLRLPFFFHPLQCEFPRYSCANNASRSRRDQRCHPHLCASPTSLEDHTLPRTKDSNHRHLFDNVHYNRREHEPRLFCPGKGRLAGGFSCCNTGTPFHFYAMFFQCPSSFPKLGWCMHQLAGCSSDHASFASPTMPFTEIFSQAFMYPLIGTLSAS